MEIGEILDVSKTERLRNFDSMNELVKSISKLAIVWSWGANSWTKMNSYYLRFKVQANRHKGHVYTCVNANDLFNIYLTTTKGKIKKVFKDVYVEDLIDTIDIEIEKVSDYQF